MNEQSLGSIVDFLVALSPCCNLNQLQQPQMDALMSKHEYKNAQAFMQSIQTDRKLQFSNDLLTKMNALSRQITKGDNNEKEPEDRSSEAHKAWAAWRALKGTDATQARKLYVQYLTEVVPDWNTPSPRL